MYQIISLFVICIFALAEANITACPSTVGYADPAKVSITNCVPEDKKCSLRRGTNVSIQFDFTVDKPVKSVKAVVHGKVFFIESPFAMPHAEVCEYSNITGVSCPLSPDQGTIRYTASLPISKKYPVINVNIKFELQNEDGEDIACLLIPAKLA